MPPGSVSPSRAHPPASEPMCRRIRQNCPFGAPGNQQCIDCVFLESMQFGSGVERAFLEHCRTIREFIEKTASEVFSSHVASILVAPNAHILDCDQRGQSFLRTGRLLRNLHNTLHGNDPYQDTRVRDAIRNAATTGRATTLLLNTHDRPQQRYSVAFIRQEKQTEFAGSSTADSLRGVLCLVAPLDRRRIATARQLMDLFGLSAAEARLARALCHGDSLEKCAADQGIKLPTVKTQLRAVFAKTGTRRQSSLTGLLSAIPVFRE